MFEKIKRFYDLKLYTDKQVRKFCEKDSSQLISIKKSPEKHTNTGNKRS